jgi:ligand-binding sensor domain-containing protein
MLAARREGVVFSTDSGVTWTPMRLPSRVKDIRKVAFSKEGELWVGAGDGVYFSRDKGETWFWLEKIPVRDIGDLTFDPKTGRMLVSSRSSQVLYSIDPATLTFTGTTTGFKLFLARSAGGIRFAASLQDGVLLEPGLMTAAEQKSLAAKSKKETPIQTSTETTTEVHPALPR